MDIKCVLRANDMIINLIISEFLLVYFLAPATNFTVKEVEQTRKQNYF
jgi:hypothetical protein